MYATDNSRALQQAADIHIAPVSGFDGQHGIKLRNEVERNLRADNNGERARYTLRIRMSQPRSQDYTLSKQGTASSYLITISADYSIIDNSIGRAVHSDTVNHSLSYGVLVDKYSTEMLRIETINLIIKNLANQISSGTLGFLSMRP